MKLVTWNVNGLRSVQKKGFAEWFAGEVKTGTEIVCLQEIKVEREKIETDESLIHPLGFESAWNCAEKPGYSGLVVYSRKSPLAVRAGLGEAEFDREGRWLEVDFKLADFGSGSGEMTVINSYFPNSQRDHARLPFKLRFCELAEKRLEDLRAQGKTVFICGDFNIAHKEIDLKNPKTNQNNAGFLPQERAWMDRFIGEKGWLDAFRVFEKSGGHYTWWSYRPGVREKNIGWRLDYFLANPEARDRLKAVSHCPDVMGSDHCPVRLELVR
jgi:exodeoxyribonuclease III